MRLSQILKAKLHHARVTYANPEYVGSVEIDRRLMERAGLTDGELVHVWAVNHGARIETYCFGGPPGVIGLNGGAAHHFHVGDRVVIAAFALTDEPITPTMLLLDDDNRVVRDMTPFSVVG
ncbi:MAG: aspartate 1-decarboxylase [Fimbriimonas ginsengisoli]|uniref:Aspartate 1-decarboxylase n=1 Tax=Fimbriimonas ginsengisoli TaxID=1005039 RepID=A0A931LT26_FIMGI|nr:aspartate 1-decarboxylase [Fimbriimonas ginsengisoli]